MDIWDIVSIILLILNIVFSILTGKKLAALIHDSALLKKRIGRGLSTLAYIPLFFLILFITCINICYLVFSELSSLMITVLLGFLGLGGNQYTGFLLSMILIALSYMYYSWRYKNVDEPLTIYARVFYKHRK